MDKVTVLLAAYRGEKWIEEQVFSILNQKNSEVAIYISIDQCDDHTLDISKRLAFDHENITILESVERFGGAAANFFRLLDDVDLLSDNFVCFADQDDIWNLDKLSVAVDALKVLEYDGYSSNVTAFWPDGRKMLIDKAQPQVEWDYLFESAGPGCTFVMTQRLALELQACVRSNKEAISHVWLHDWFAYAFARSHGYKWYIDKYPSMLYRQHQNNQVGVNTGYKAFLHRMKYVISGKALDQSLHIAKLCGLGGHSFVKNWNGFSRLGMLRLALNATRCRRRPYDQVIFAFTCIVLFLIGHKKT